MTAVGSWFGGAWVDRGDGVVRYAWGDPVPGVVFLEDGSPWAPELAPHLLVSTGELAGLAGVKAGSVRQFVSRGAVPPPMGRVGVAPWWSRPVVDRWLEVGRGRGASRWWLEG